MIKTIRRGAAALLAAIVLTGSLTGCGTWSNTKIVLTTGLTGDQLFKDTFYLLCQSDLI